jgi:hypothetical protein
VTVHPLVSQLRFTRAEWVRGLEGVSGPDATRRLGAINSIGWMIGHLAWQEQAYWLQRAQGKTLVPDVEPCGNGQPACTPRVDEMWAAWRTITTAADAYLDTLSPDALLTRWEREPTTENIGTKLLRMIYHYWFHLGEAQAVRQALGHTGLPSFVGDIAQAPYRPESSASV